VNHLNLFKSGKVRFGIFNRSGKNEVEVSSVKRKLESKNLKCQKDHVYKVLSALPEECSGLENIACRLCQTNLGKQFDASSPLHACSDRECNTFLCRGCFELEWKSSLFLNVNNPNNLDQLYDNSDRNF